MSVEDTIAHETVTKVLLVDDRHENLLALQAILEPLNVSLVLAHSGREALKHVLQSDFAVILLDVLMPDLDGFETAALIKEREQSKSIPIIFLTAISTHEQYVSQGYSVGAVDYMSKPFEAEILRSKVSVFVDLFRKNEQLKHQSALLRLAQERERAREIAELRHESDQRYRRLAESLPEVVWTAGEDGATTYCNRGWLDANTSNPTPWRRAIHFEHLPEFEGRWRAALESGGGFEMELRLQLAPRTPHRWHLTRVQRELPPRGSRDGRGAAWIVTCTDIDDRRRAEDGLRFLADAATLLAESLDYHVTVSRVASLAVRTIADWCIVDLRTGDGAPQRIACAHEDPHSVDLARELRSLVPHTSFDTRGRASFPRFLCGCDELPESLARWDELLHGCDCIVAPLVTRKAVVGRVALASCHRQFGPTEHSLVDDLARKIVAAVENAELYETARLEHARLEKANRAKDEFLAMVSHELRTPLNAVLGWTQLLRTGELDDVAAARGLETIERNARSQAKLIADILDVSRIISGKLRLNTTHVDLSAVIRTAIDSVRPEAEGKGVDLRADLAVLEPVNGDVERLQQVAWNLLSNAIKFTSRGGHVSVRVLWEAEFVGFEVVDTGIGIGPEFLPHVFEPFTQDDNNGPTRTKSGLGLGLSIVRSIIALHGGRVRAHSDGAGCGSTFTVELPRAWGGRSDRGAPPTPVNGARGVRELEGVRVLVVEDVADGREFLEHLLASSGASVTAVGSAAEAHDALARNVFDLLLSDIGMPGESGYDLIRKARERGATLPAVAFTAYAAEADREQALSAGFQAHFAKPIDAPALIRLLKSLSPKATSS